MSARVRFKSLLAALFLASAAALAAAAETPAQLMNQAQERLKSGDSLAAFAKARAAMLALWRQMPLQVVQATFVRAPAAGYGIYEPRANARFTSGEKLLVYLEPAGYAFVRSEDGRHHFRLAVDIAIADANGKVLGGKKDFARFAVSSRRRNLEYFISLKLELDGIPPGRYQLVVNVRDEIGKASTTATLPFEIAS